MKKLVLVLLFSLSSLFAFEDLTTANFDKKIRNKNVIIDFYAIWWDACEVLGKNLTKYNTSKTEDVTIYKVNIDEHKAIPKRFKVRRIPALLYIDKQGNVKWKDIGVISDKKIKSKVQKYFK